MDPKPTTVIAVGIKPKGQGDGPSPVGPLDQMGMDNDSDMGMDDGDCSTCCYFDGQMICMRYPEWQKHDPTDWCGEYRQGDPHQLKTPTTTQPETQSGPGNAPTR